MESKGTGVARKRVKPTVEDTEPIEGDKALDEIVEGETDIHPAVSEQMELEIGHILEKINRFTQLVATLNYLSHKIEHVVISNNPLNYVKFEVIPCIMATVSELLESGKSLLKELSNEFEERLILVHKEQIDKWQEEIKELRMLDASNEDVNALLHNARYLLQNVHSDS